MKPRLGFLGVGWIGRHRMEAIAQAGVATIAGIADPHRESRDAALNVAPDARAVESLDELVAMELDGLVIATPSAVHAEQAKRVLDRGLAVFCQKPLGRHARECANVVDAARRANRLLGVDFSYRFTDAMRALKPLVERGELGRVYAMNLVFHNAYGPDKPWFYDPKLSGGGCVMDLGIHLVDLALWTLGFPEVERVTTTLFANGERLTDSSSAVEDYTAAQLELGNGVAVQLACSWKLQAGCDSVIEASFFGTNGGASMRNVNGSFYDFTLDRFRGTSQERLVSPPDAWGGRAAVDWARRLADGEKFSADVAHVVDVARVIDRIRLTRE